MFYAFMVIAEERIQQAQRNGEFDNLEGKGKPLVFEDDGHIAPELRMAHKILKNSGSLPPEVDDLKEIQTTRDLLATLTDEYERYRQMQKLNTLVTKVNSRRKRPIQLEEQEVYYERVVGKMHVRKRT